MQVLNIILRSCIWSLNFSDLEKLDSINFTMNVFFLYEIPLGVSFLIFTGFFATISVISVIILRPIVKQFSSGYIHNNEISSYLSTIGVFYGIMFGLQAAAVWKSYQDVNDKVTNESSAIAALYRDVSEFPKESADQLKQKLGDYTYYVIHYAWPLHRQGIVKTKGTYYLNIFQKSLYQIEPSSPADIALYSEAIKQFNVLVELRRARLISVDTGIPILLWIFFISGALITIILASLFFIENIRFHILLNSFIGLTLGSLMFIMVMMDRPFRGKLAIGPESYQSVYEDLMVGHVPQMEE